MNPLDETWRPTPCPTHDTEKCSLWKELGYEAKLCPTCKAHVRNDICLNTCHLSKASQQRFADLMRSLRK